MVSTTANSRERSCMIRAIRYRYFARSLPGRRDQTVSCARRAAVTARFTSAFVAFATRESVSSVAGLITSKVAFGRDGAKALSMKRPYSRRIWMWSVDSGADAYSHGIPRFERPHEAGAGRLSGFLVRVTRPIIAPVIGGTLPSDASDQTNPSHRGHRPAGAGHWPLQLPGRSPAGRHP